MKKGYIDWANCPHEKLIDDEKVNLYFPKTLAFRKLVDALMERSRDDQGRYLITIDQACEMVQRDLAMGKCVRESVAGAGVLT